MNILIPLLILVGVFVFFLTIIIMATVLYFALGVLVGKIKLKGNKCSQAAKSR